MYCCRSLMASCPWAGGGPFSGSFAQARDHGVPGVSGAFLNLSGRQFTRRAERAKPATSANALTCIVASEFRHLCVRAFAVAVVDVFVYDESTSLVSRAAIDRWLA